MKFIEPAEFKKKNVKLNFRISSDDFTEMQKAITKFNENKSGLEINQNVFLRMAVRLMNDKILNKGLVFGFKGDSLEHK